MKTRLHHLQINVSNNDISFPFYKEMLGFLGFKVTYEDETVVGFDNGGFSVWVNQTEKKYADNKYHRKGTGLNHLAFNVGSKKAVDDFTNKFLRIGQIKTLYKSPRLFPEYSPDYYAVYFEDPDRIKLEVMTM